MTQRNRTLIVAVALGAALAVALPTPSEAAGRRGGGLPVLDVWERAWDWLARLAGPGEVARWEKEGSAIDPDGMREKEGGAIDPNGSPTPGSAAPAPDASTSEQGGAIDPNGAT